MKNRAILLVVIVSISAVQCGPFTATLSTPRVQEMGGDVICHATITNNHDEDYYLLKRNTPLEKLRSHIFAIHDDEKSIVQYDGFLVKRALPTEEEYIRVPGKSSVSSTVVLSKAYSFDRPGTYSVQLDTQVLYSKSLTPAPDPLSQRLSSNTSPFLFMDTGKPPQLTEPEILRMEDGRVKASNMPQAISQQEFEEPTFNGSWPNSERDVTETAYATAYSKVDESADAVLFDEQNYIEWFGTARRRRQRRVRKVYNSVLFDMEVYSFVLHYYGEYCEEGYFAYTWYNSLDIILCDEYFSADPTGYDSKFGTIIHELTHAVKNTDDIHGAYGTIGARDLAATDPSKAVKNADNYEYFSESL